jgi:ribosomal protein L37AE/L43A
MKHGSANCLKDQSRTTSGWRCPDGHESPESVVRLTPAVVPNLEESMPASDPSAPENRKPGHPCPKCKSAESKQISGDNVNGDWRCQSCNLVYEDFTSTVYGLAKATGKKLVVVAREIRSGTGGRPLSPAGRYYTPSR